MISLRCRPTPVIRWRGKSYGIAAAFAAATAEYRRGRFQAAAEIYALILARAPNHAEILNNQGVVLQQMQRYEAALANYDRAIAARPDYANAHYNRGTLLRKLMRPDEALASYDRALACNHGHVEAHNNRGILLLAKGDLPGARQMFLQAVALKPDFPDPWFNLANMRHFRDSEAPEVKAIRVRFDRRGIAPEEKEHWGFTLGTIYDGCGDYAAAFAYYHQANQIRNTLVAYDACQVEAMTRAMREAFPCDSFLPSAWNVGIQSPLFIVGMPRSGTTLLASILSNHPAVATAGELSAIPDITSRLPGNVPYPIRVNSLTGAVLEQLAAEYEKRLRCGVLPSVHYIIDKNPLNFRHLGFIARLFPGARIIHCTRHPLASCLSNYFQRFPLYMDYAFDWRNICHFHREYDRLMAHWRTIPALNLMEVSYEELILDTERAVRRMLGFLGLEWNAGCLAPHLNPCRVETASQWQVRQPIYRDSAEKWRHYEPYLKRAGLEINIPFSGS